MSRYTDAAQGGEPALLAEGTSLPGGLTITLVFLAIAAACLAAAYLVKRSARR
ncbi:hypothetical protein IQ279_06035 [Streptomyces verrucosisporus]|uniref:hypothetical protein n=1 Tax=Streptomyces verrucosisporus TaxID=1695161 RepID=UPI0019D03454|nr:hypothetical protein [Streptomyces verrucosisporus]MBN3929203.1 hypothetical protein [Streptomyces verrucosisporus]